MTLQRREFVVLLAAVAPRPFLWPVTSMNEGGGAMYGVIGKMVATPGQRDALAAILLDGTASMPGCLSYVIATDPSEPCRPRSRKDAP
jgi:hypothetical protein